MYTCAYRLELRKWSLEKKRTAFENEVNLFTYCVSYRQRQGTKEETGSKRQGCAASIKHGAAGSPARWKQHVNQTTLRNRWNMIFQHLKNISAYACRHTQAKKHTRG